MLQERWKLSPAFVILIIIPPFFLQMLVNDVCRKETNMNGDIKTENNMITLKELYRSLYNAVEAYLYGLLEINASGIIQYIKDCAAIKTSNADYDSDRRKHVSTMVSNYQKDANYWFGAPLKDCIAMIYDEV